MQECFLRSLLLLWILIHTTLVAVEPHDVNTSQEENLTKVEIPVFYKDYDWDIGIIGGLTFDGTQIDYTRYTLGTGIHVAYHYDDAVSFHGEYVKYFKSFVPSKYDSNGKEIVQELTTTNIMAASVAYDFSADRTYSLFAKAGLGYEIKDDPNAIEQKSPVSLMGFGFRYMFSEHISGYVEGRWKMRLSNISEPDNSLIGTVGLDYHFGLSDEKKKLMEDAEAHNAKVDALLKERQTSHPGN